MLDAILGGAAKSAARAAVARAKAREDLLAAKGYRCPSCGTADVPKYRMSHREKLTFAMWLRGGLIPWLFRKVKDAELACPRCHHVPDLSPWLAGTEFASELPPPGRTVPNRSPAR